MKHFYVFLILLTAFLCGGSISAQECSLEADSLARLPLDLGFKMAVVDPTIRPEDKGALTLDIDNASFFKDNEYEGTHVCGYSLPGLWIQPRLVYQPLKMLRMELGLHALIYSGANKYPCYVYHDIGVWKGDQYQSGAHVLPFFRAQVQLGKHVNLVFGDIYGGSNHQLMEPLFNPELNLTQDPEMGFQVLVKTKNYRLDAWLNWQSYIFQNSSHQEAFTVGAAQRICLNRPSSDVHWYIPIDILLQHRGGEQDTTSLGVQTITNGGVGVGMQYNANGKTLQRLTVEMAGLACWQQSGQLWPFNSGFGASVSISASMWKMFRLFAGCVYARDFVSLYGVPFYSTLSVQKKGARYDNVVTPHIGFEWSMTFAKDYTVGAKAVYYPTMVGEMTYADMSTTAAKCETNFNFGVYLRCHPKFNLLKHKKQ